MSDAQDPKSPWSAPGSSSNEDAAGNSYSNHNRQEDYNTPANSWDQQNSYGQQDSQAGYQQGSQPGYGQNNQPGYQQYGQPGYQQGQVQPGYQQYGQPGYQQAGYQRTMTYQQVKPGIVPIRPLGVGDIIAGSFSLIRFNPQATVGLTLIVALIAGIVSFGFAAIFDAINPNSIIGSVGVMTASVLSALLSTAIVGLLMGPLTIVTVEAVKGNKISPMEAWRTFVPRIWSYILYYLLMTVASIALISIVVGLGAALFSSTDSGWPVAIFLLLMLGMFIVMVYVYIKMIIAMPAIANEGIGPLQAIKRSWSLTKGVFWPTFGTFLLTMLIIQALTVVITLPIGLVLGVGGTLTGMTGGFTSMMMVSEALIQIISLLISAPLTAALVALIYVNMRIRNEGFDIEILGNLNR